MITKPKAKTGVNEKELIISEIHNLFIKAGKKVMLTDHNISVIKTLVCDPVLGSNEPKEILMQRVINFIKYFDKSNFYQITDFFKKEFDPVLPEKKESENSDSQEPSKVSPSFMRYFSKLDNRLIKYKELQEMGCNRQEFFLNAEQNINWRGERFSVSDLKISSGDIPTKQDLKTISWIERNYDCVCFHTEILLMSEIKIESNTKQERQSAILHNLFDTE